MTLATAIIYDPCACSYTTCFFWTLILKYKTCLLYNFFGVCFCRTSPDEVGLEKVAAALKKHNIHGLVIIGGFEV